MGLGIEAVAVLTNPAAGKGRSRHATGLVHARLRAAGVSIVSVQGRDAAESAERLRSVLPEVGAVVTVGGDGLVNLALQVVARTGVPLGLVPAGTGNDAGRYLGLTRREPDAAVRALVAALRAGRTRRLDLARTGGRYYLTVLAAGFDAIVNERANAMRWPRGRARYHLATVAELRVFEPLPYTLVLDGVERRREAMLVAVGNGPSFGGGLRITHDAVLDDGLLDVVAIKPVSKPELVRTYPQLLTGAHTRHRQYETHRARVVTVAAPGVVAYADGERFGPLPLTVECVPGALEVLV